jgi:PPM family protein phosphatase
VTRLVVGSATDVGLVRSNNQDQLLVTPGLYAVADGMGGHAAGEVASLTAIKALDAAFEASDEHTASSLVTAAQAANSAVWEQARTNRGMLGMGTTLVALAVVEREDGTNGLAVAHIGDSRLYRYRDQALKQLTVDHSLVQELVDEGQISEAQAAVHPQRHVLTRALGVEPAVDVDLIDISPEDDDRFLLCSDGLPREASDEDIADVLERFADPSEAARELVELAKSRGGSDNVTVVVVDVLANENSPDAIIVPSPTASSTADVDDTGAIETVTSDDGGSRVAEPSEPSGRDRAAGTSALAGPYTRRVTLRVVGFVVALCLVLGAAVASMAWYARSSYFVTLKQGRIAIFHGRPGGVLWFQPTLSHLTAYSSASVLSYDLQSLKSGQLEPSLGQADQYVKNLVAAKEEARLADQPPPRGGPASTTSTPVTRVSTGRGTTTSPTTTPARRPTTTRSPVTTGRSAPGGTPTSSRATSPSTVTKGKGLSTGIVATSRPGTKSRPAVTGTATTTRTVPPTTRATSPGTTKTGAGHHTAATSKPTATNPAPTTRSSPSTQSSGPGHASGTTRPAPVSHTTKTTPTTVARTSPGP